MSELPPGVTMLQDPGGRDALQLEHGDNRVVISLTGAQVLSWHRPGGDVLWTASYPAFEAGKPVRGGVPVVFPWFGDHKTDPQMPAHGFARTLLWQLAECSDGPDVVLTARDSESTRELWPFAFGLRLLVSLRDTLRMALTVENTGDEPFSCEQALHTYYNVGDVSQATVHGLENTAFVEHAKDPEGEWDTSQPIHFRAETDRVFQGTRDELAIVAASLGRRINLRSTGARSAIVWNPWPKKAARLSQMDVDDYKQFCCVETANVGENDTTLQPGERHTLELTLSAEPA